MHERVDGQRMGQAGSPLLDPALAPAAAAAAAAVEGAEGNVTAILDYASLLVPATPAAVVALVVGRDVAAGRAMAQVVSVHAFTHTECVCVFFYMYRYIDQ